MKRIWLELICNQLLRTAPLTQARLSKLEGKTLELSLSQPRLLLRLHVHRGRLVFLDQCQAVDCQIKAPLSSLLQLAMAADKTQSLSELDVHIMGDSQVLMALQNLLAAPDFEPEAMLTPYLGASISGVIGQLRHGLTAALMAQLQSLQQMTDHWLFEESQWLLTRSEFAEHSQGVDQVRRQSASLSQRLSRLEACA